MSSRPMFQKRHFEAIAEVMSSVWPNNVEGIAARNLIEFRLLKLFANDNPQFDRTRFREACDGTKGEEK